MNQQTNAVALKPGDIITLSEDCLLKLVSCGKYIRDDDGYYRVKIPRWKFWKRGHRLYKFMYLETKHENN